MADNPDLERRPGAGEESREEREVVAKNILQFQTAEERLTAKYRKNKADFMRLIRKISRATPEELREMGSIWLSKNQQIADRFAELREAADRFGIKGHAIE